LQSQPRFAFLLVSISFISVHFGRKCLFDNRK